MIKGISLGETEEKYSQYDKEEPRTLWKIGVIDTMIMSEIRDKITVFEADREVDPSAQSRTARTKLNLHMADIEYVRHGLKGFTNFCDSNGNAIMFRTERRFCAGKQMDVVSEEILSIIPMPIIEELAFYIKNKNVLSEQEIKN